jgi:hypothetical protein
VGQSQAAEGAAHEARLIGTQHPWASGAQFLPSEFWKEHPGAIPNKRRDPARKSPPLWVRLSFRPIVPSAACSAHSAEARVQVQMLKAYANQPQALDTGCCDVSLLTPHPAQPPLGFAGQPHSLRVCGRSWVNEPLKRLGCLRSGVPSCCPSLPTRLRILSTSGYRMFHFLSNHDAPLHRVHTTDACLTRDCLLICLRARDPQ